jgi:hypothetical protein
VQSDDHRAKELTWLPTLLPPNVKLVVSLVESQDQAEYIGAQGWPAMRVSRLPKPTLEKIMEHQLQTRGKALSTAQRERVFATPACENPLFLVVLVAELCQFGEFERLDAKIAQCLRCPDTTALFEEVLRRLDEDFALRPLTDGTRSSRTPPAAESGPCLALLLR